MKKSNLLIIGTSLVQILCTFYYEIWISMGSINNMPLVFYSMLDGKFYDD